jgi:hypothetical protein
MLGPAVRENTSGLGREHSPSLWAKAPSKVDPEKENNSPRDEPASFPALRHLQAQALASFSCPHSARTTNPRLMILQRTAGRLPSLLTSQAGIAHEKSARAQEHLRLRRRDGLQLIPTAQFKHNDTLKLSFRVRSNFDCSGRQVSRSGTWPRSPASHSCSPAGRRQSRLAHQNARILSGWMAASAASALELHQRRRALAVVVADVDSEAHFRPAAAAAHRTGEQP